MDNKDDRGMIRERHNHSKRHLLAQNTVFLYLMTFSTYALNLFTLPYLTRVLGPTVYGHIGLTVGYMTYIQIILDFGFILSATQLISDNRNDSNYASSIITSVTIVKMALCCVVLVVLFGLFKLGFFEVDVVKLLAVYLLSYLCAALLPDYFYRGIENMKIISIRTVSIKILFTVLVFVLVKSKDDVIFVPASMLVGNFLALLITYYDLHKRYRIHLRKPSIAKALDMVKISAPFFVSRFASTFYQALDVIVLGKIYGSSPVVGYYSSADKLIALAKTGAYPLADSLYPYMLKNKNYRLVKKLLLIVMPIITAGAIIVGSFAKPICVLLFGPEYSNAGNILRLLLPIAWVVLPSYIIAFPIMTPLGLVKYTNISNVIGMFFQMLGFAILYVLRVFNVYTICGLTSITEMLVFLFRLAVVLIHISKTRKVNS